MARREPAARSSRAEVVAADLEHEISVRAPPGRGAPRPARGVDGPVRHQPHGDERDLADSADRDLVSVRPGRAAASPSPIRHRRSAPGHWTCGSSRPTRIPSTSSRARLYLEFGLTKAAFERATSADIAVMRDAMVQMRASQTAREFFRRGVEFPRCRRGPRPTSPYSRGCINWSSPASRRC